MSTPFNRPYLTGKELENIQQAFEGRHLAGNGPFSKRCEAYLEKATGTKKALLTHSCTAALEMAALMIGLEPGDEVIMPSFTFVTTASAVALRGGIPVFVDIREDTLNIDETKIEEAITSRTKAICVVHYAGVGAEMDRILEIARKHKLFVIEDVAQGMNASYKGKALGSIGDLGAISFHETKNIVSGEGGCLLINNAKFEEKGEIVREKGTNRINFLRKEVAFYTWVDLGSSFLPSEILAAVLLAQLEESPAITAQRLKIWNHYHAALAPVEERGLLRRPIVPESCKHNGHLYYILARSPEEREQSIAKLKEDGIQSVFHYLPLHLSPAGKKYGRVGGDLSKTVDLSARLLRLPLWPELESVEKVAASLVKVLG
jgi:dTDP-4-amino-4,6-dideoxygalactose transaminase